LWAGAEDDVWVAGSHSGRAAAWHWDGASWTRHQIGETTGVVALAGTTGTDIWASLGTRNPQFSRWDGARWHESEQAPGLYSGMATSMWATSSRDVWAAANFFGGGLPARIYRWQGQSWAQVDYGPLAYGPSTSVAAVSARAAWFAVGHAFLRYDGQRFTPMTEIPARAGPVELWAGDEQDLWALSGAGQKDVIADIWRWDGTRWFKEKSAAGMRAIWGRCGGPIWTVGFGGQALRFE
jgi:hypothetical protein